MVWVTVFTTAVIIHCKLYITHTLDNANLRTVYIFCSSRN